MRDDRVWMFARRVFIVCLGVAACGLVQASSTTTYEYLVYTRGMLAGTAEVQVKRTQDRYEIRGDAEATGFMAFLSRWSAWFSVAGRTESGMPLVQTYEHVDSNRRRVKEVRIADGMVSYVRSGEAREPMEIPAKVDLFSLIFVLGECREAVRAFTGRIGFDARLVEANVDEQGERCDYAVVDDEDDRYEAGVWIKRVNGVRVLSRLKIEGYARGDFRIKDVVREEGE